MDYDRTEIATSYDQARALMPETARLWLDLIAAQVGRSTSLIVDLGCGTGRFSDLLAAHFGVQVIGFDPSQKMIDQARRKPTTDTVSYRHGAAEAIPLSDGSADLVFMSNVYHHLSNPIAAARECRRTLRSGGRVCLRNGTCELDFPYRHFFPGLDSLINSEMPSQGDIEETFVRAGFARSLHQVIRQVVAPEWQGLVDKMRLRADSFLARLSDKDFEQGMIALQSPDRTIDQRGVVTEEIGWFVFARLG